MSSPSYLEAETAERSPPARSSRSAGGFMRNILREPLLHFLLLGALIFAVSAIAGRRKDDAARRIVVDDQRVAHFISLYQAQMGRAPSKQEIEAMIQGYIQEEVRFREAMRLGLDAGDEIVRRRLASKFEFLEADPVTVPEPSPEELQRYYEAHSQDFQKPERITFTHVYFSPDREGDAAARVRAESALAKLQHGTFKRAPELGDRFPLQADYADLSRLDLVQLFGDGPMVAGLMTGPVNQWVGALRSGYGWHLVYVSQREAASIPPLAEIQDQVKGAYLDSAKQDARREKYQTLEKTYIIERSYSL